MTGRFVVLASDGLWDVMSSDEVVDFLHHQARGCWSVDGEWRLRASFCFFRAQYLACTKTDLGTFNLPGLDSWISDRI